MGNVRTNVNGEISDGWEEDPNIRTGNEFGVHPTSVFEKSATQ